MDANWYQQELLEAILVELLVWHWMAGTPLWWGYWVGKTTPDPRWVLTYVTLGSVE